MYLRVYCDASHGLHEDGKGVIGIIIMMGSGYIYAKSGKIKFATLSSTESEGRAMKEAGTYIVWAREMLYFFGYRMEGPTKLFQDNLSAIWLASHDGSFQRNKHTVIERAFVKDLIDEKVMTCIHQDTERLGQIRSPSQRARRCFERPLRQLG